MPRQYHPNKSGVHRVACLALYRSLIQHATKIPLESPLVTRLKSIIKTEFSKNALLQSPPKIVAALEFGYKCLKTLKDVTSAPPQALLRLSTFIATAQVQLRTTPRKCHPQAKGGPIVWPRPNTPRVLSRPYPTVSGTRRIPILTHTMGFPFLRFKKPQSPFLSRVLRDKIEQKQRRVDQQDALEELMVLAVEEDKWDKLIQDLGVKETGPTWAEGVNHAKKEIDRRLYEGYLANVEMGKKMRGIVEAEIKLAQEE